MELTEEKSSTFVSSERKEKFSGRNSRRKTPVRLSKLKYEEKIVQVKRVTKVTTGGKKMTFRAIVIIGDKKRKVGVGIGRAEDVNLAIDKAVLNGKKNLITIPLTLNSSIPHVINASYGACKIMLRPASLGTGVIAGGSVKTVLELGGLKNILAKQFGSSNILNNAKATVRALTFLNEKIELGKTQSNRKSLFYDKVMKKYKNVGSNN
jgi:small subunit ribosomal protein S5|tara:strand:- start:62 stop:685 length:624 start_codon:yes stop_codon:yes gene_type:complete